MYRVTRISVIVNHQHYLEQVPSQKSPSGCMYLLPILRYWVIQMVWQLHWGPQSFVNWHTLPDLTPRLGPNPIQASSVAAAATWPKAREQMFLYLEKASMTGSPTARWSAHPVGTVTLTQESWLGLGPKRAYSISHKMTVTTVHLHVAVEIQSWLGWDRQSCRAKVKNAAPPPPGFPCNLSSSSFKL